MKQSALVQISIHISPQAEEAVSVLLERIFGLLPSIYTNAETLRTTATIYLEPKLWRESLRREISKGLSEIRKCGLDAGPGKISIQKLRRENWAESWKRHFKPIEIGNALLIKPSWSRRKAKKNQALVVLDPGLSFGTGQHATTSFCLQQIVKYRLASQKQSFLDIGTGSGILAIAAAKLGYAPVEAFDFDPESVRVSGENARSNDVARALHIFQKDLCQLPLRSREKFDLICANLIYDLLLAEMGKIVTRLSPNGHLVLAGILCEQFPKVRRCAESFGLKLVALRAEKEWQSGCFRFEV